MRRAAVFDSTQGPVILSFPLSPQFQETLLRILLEDRDFSAQVAAFIKHSYFTSEIHQWIWMVVEAYREKYGITPSGHWVHQAALALPPGQRELYAGTVVRIGNAPLMDVPALKDQLVQFLRQAIFRVGFSDTRALFNMGKVEEAFEVMRESITALDRVSLTKRGRVLMTSASLADRQMARDDGEPVQQRIGTGFPDLDKRMGGGAYPGFLGIWIAYPKAGKSALLINHGAVAAHVYGKRVFHAVLEGRVQEVTDRYDALFSGVSQNVLRAGNMDYGKHCDLFATYERMGDRLIVQDYTESWDTNITHIEADLQDLEKNHGWRPDLIVVDYVDLLKGRKTNYKSTTEGAVDATQDLKRLANRGYVIWTASQVQRPRNGADAKTVQDILYSSQIADCYARVRIADFVGSINQTDQEKEQKVMRLYAELFRNGPANLLIPINADFETMRFGANTSAASQAPQATRPAPQLGYGAMRQTLAGQQK